MLLNQPHCSITHGKYGDLSLRLLSIEAKSKWRQNGSTTSRMQGSLLKSTLHENVGSERDVVAQSITFRALGDIRAWEELYVILESRLSIANPMFEPESPFSLMLPRRHLTSLCRLLKGQH